MNRALSWTAPLFAALLMAACHTVPRQQTTELTISPKLARLYSQMIKSENALSPDAFKPATYASDDPKGFYGHFLPYTTRTKDADDILLTQLDRIIPNVQKLNSVEAAKTRALLDELQKRFGISFYALGRMGWSSDRTVAYVKRHSVYGVTRLVRYMVYDPEHEIEKRKRSQWYESVRRSP